MTNEIGFWEPLQISPYGKVRYEVKNCGYKTDCWVWLLGKHPSGKLVYGSLNGREMAHRFFYRKLVGDIPENNDVHHKCENTLCVNPDHLEAKTRKEHIDIHLTGKKQDPDFVARRTAHMAKGMNSLNPDGSKPCEPGCKCPRHERHWEKRINSDPRSKLNEEKVLEIRSLSKEGKNRKYIANKFDIAVNTVCNVVNYKAWSHVP